MKNYIFVIGFVLISFVASAQLKIEVQVRDSIDRYPLPFTKISVKSKALGIVNGLADSIGVYTITLPKPDTVRISVSFVGFFDTSEQIYFESDTILSLFISPRVNMLKEAEIIGRKQVINKKVDRTVLNLNPKYDKGKKVTDLMRKLPFVSATTDELLIKGKSNFAIYKNGSPSNLTFMDLRNLTAEQVESIEVIYYPSSRYEGEFEQVVNVVMRRQINTTSLSSWIGVGHRAKTGINNNSIGFSGTIWKEKSSQGLQFSLNTDALKSESNQFYTSGGFQEINQIDEIKSKNSYLDLNYNYESIFQKNQEIGFNIKLSLRGNNSNGVFSRNPNMTSSQIFRNDKSQNIGNFELLKNYAKKFPKGTQLFLSNILTIGTDELNLNNNNSSISESVTDKFNLISQLALESKINDNFNLEYGAGIINRNFKQNTTYTLGQDGFLRFKQFVTNQYFSISRNWKELHIRGGIRAEQTINQPNTLSYKFTNNFLPKLLVSQKISEQYSIVLNYNMRVQRPSYNFLNIFYDINNPLIGFIGNPNLLNETYQNISFEHNVTIGATELSINTDVQIGNNLISGVRFAGEQFLNVNYDNVSTSKKAGLSYSLTTATANQKWYLSTSGNIQKLKIWSDFQRNEGIIYSVNGGVTYMPTDKLSIDFFASVLQNQVTLQSLLGNSLYMDILLNYIIDQRSSIMLRSQNPIQNRIISNNIISGESFSLKQREIYFGRTLEFSFSYNLGKSKNTKSNLRKIKENDLKEKE